MYTIGEISTLVNISTNTLRYYDEILLLRPTQKNNQNGYRMYSHIQIKEILLIQELKYYGFTLNEIKTLLYANQETLAIALKNKLQILKQTYYADEMRIKIIMKKLGELGMEKNKLIMVVECVNFERLLMKDILASYGYDNIIEAQDGVEAFEKYEQYRPDLVISGIVMPKQDGLHTCDIVVKKYPDAKFVLCTAMSQLHILHEAVQAGSIDFISKPLQTERFISSVINLLNDTQQNKIKVSRLNQLQDELNKFDEDCFRNLPLTQQEVDTYRSYFERQDDVSCEEIIEYLNKLKERHMQENIADSKSFQNVAVKNGKTDFQKVPLNIALQREINNQILFNIQDTSKFPVVMVDFVWSGIIEMYVLSQSNIKCFVVKNNNEVIGAFCYPKTTSFDQDRFNKNFIEFEKTILINCENLCIEPCDSIRISKSDSYILSTFVESNHNMFSLFLLNNMYITN